MPTFIECTSLNISYDIMGIATVTYTVVSDLPGVNVYNQIIAGGQIFTGYATNVSYQKIPETDWYETSVTLVTTTAT